ncbi:KAP family NTPase [Hellea sp.]|nr:KAP family NTPase [Hellea sp.]
MAIQNTHLIEPDKFKSVGEMFQFIWKSGAGNVLSETGNAAPWTLADMAAAFEQNGAKIDSRSIKNWINGTVPSSANSHILIDIVSGGDSELWEAWMRAYEIADANSLIRVAQDRTRGSIKAEEPKKKATPKKAPAQKPKNPNQTSKAKASSGSSTRRGVGPTGKTSKEDNKSDSLQSASQSVSLTMGQNIDPQSYSFVFASTNKAGTRGNLNGFVLDKLEIKPADLKGHKQLRKDGFCIIKTPSQTGVFVVTVEQGSTANNLRQNLKAALLSLIPLHQPSDTIWLPLMGNGVGGLPDVESAEITAQVLHAFLNEAPNHHFSEVTISTPGRIKDIDHMELERPFEHRFETFKIIFPPKNNPSSPTTDEGVGAIDGQISINTDQAQKDEDSLGRDVLAISFAWMLHETWCGNNGIKPISQQGGSECESSFVAHIDSPWGGGKTSFANLVARVLNPQLDGSAPKFLKKRYPGRKDISGLFISSAHNLGGLKDKNSNDYIWEQEGRKPWIITTYNAWQSQHVDPPWWSFYQTILHSCSDALKAEGVPIVRQEADGTYHTVGENGLKKLGRWLRLWSIEVSWRFWTPRVKNSAWVFALVVLVSFILEKFGAVNFSSLGDVFNNNEEKSTNLFEVLSTSLVALLGGASSLWALFSAFTQSLVPGTPGSAKNYSLGSSDPLQRFRVHFAKQMQRVGRPVLVIIDDIDRCEPKFVVETIRGLQTIFPSPKVTYLLLGDRNWICQAFEHVHGDMADMDVGGEHTFGGRFVEKAIQLSYILPGIGSHKEDYVRELLTGRKQDTSSSVSDEEILSIRENINALDTPEHTLAAKQSAVAGIKTQSKEKERALRRAANSEAVLSLAGNKSNVEQTIGHRLEPIADLLPSNPRHIKRIVNAIYMYQNGLQLSEDNTDSQFFGGKLWRQLVIGVILSQGFQKSWARLVKNPKLADALTHGGSMGVSKSAEEIEFSSVEQNHLSEFRKNTTFMQLLDNRLLSDETGQGKVLTQIDGQAVQWLESIGF